MRNLLAFTCCFVATACGAMASDVPAQRFVQVYSDIVFSSSTENVKSVMVDGKWLVKDRKSSIYDQQKLIADGKEELKMLLKRI